MKLKNKIKIKGNIVALTGLHVGGNKSSLEIGGVDLNVIKTGNGTPYIPGSSFKGKMRSLLGKVRGSEKVKDDSADIKILFGDEGGRETADSTITRLQVRDANLNKNHFEEKFKGGTLDYEFSEIKTENRIDRSNGRAEHPRQVERVPSGAVFNFEIVVDIYDDDKSEVFLKLLKEALQLLEYDYLGGHGSRGSGQVKIEGVVVSGLDIREDGISDMGNESWGNMFDQFNVAVSA